MIFSVLLFILKIIGIILLCILAVLLIAVLLALFAKLRYNLKCGNDNGTYFNGNVSYLFGIVKVKADYKDEELHYSVKIFGKKLIGNEPNLKENKKNSKKSDFKKEDKKDTEYKAKEAEKINPADNKEKQTENTEIQNTEPNVQKKTASKNDAEKEVKFENKKEENVFSEKKISWQDKYSNIKYDHSSDDFTVRRVKINEIIEETEKNENKTENKENILNKEFEKSTEQKEQNEETEDISENSENKVDIKYFLNMPMSDKKIILKGAYKFIKRFCKTVLPKTVLINAKAGVGDPAGTGLMMALCGIVKGLFIEGLNVSGDFDNIMFLGNAEFSGRFTIGYLLYSTLCFIILKPVRKAVILFIKN